MGGWGGGGGGGQTKKQNAVSRCFPTRTRAVYKRGSKERGCCTTYELKTGHNWKSKKNKREKGSYVCNWETKGQKKLLPVELSP